ncbi:MAG: flagellar basal body L-ring protein FlgH [Bradymonadales bacterium]|nr:MAG: flagellar basal body L-ring protein FlgH [Bradymonadales bacterium]
MKAFYLILLFFLVGCAAAKSVEPTLNERMLKEQRARIEAGEDVYGRKPIEPTDDLAQSSLWARSSGSPYIIRNQKAQDVGDLLTVVIDEQARGSASASTDTSRDSSIDFRASMGAGTGSAQQLGIVQGSGDTKTEFQGDGSTDRSGRLTGTVQAVVEEILPNGIFFVRGRKVVTINDEDQEFELTGFIRPDDIRINNTVTSSLMADAQIRYVGKGVIGDKQRVGWGTRIFDFIWPF